MRTFIKNTPTESRRNVFLTAFRNSKRVQWVASRQFTY